MRREAVLSYEENDISRQALDSPRADGMLNHGNADRSGELDAGGEHCQRCERKSVSKRYVASFWFAVSTGMADELGMDALVCSFGSGVVLRAG